MHLLTGLYYACGLRRAALEVVSALLGAHGAREQRVPLVLCFRLVWGALVGLWMVLLPLPYLYNLSDADKKMQIACVCFFFCCCWMETRTREKQENNPTAGRRRGVFWHCGCCRPSNEGQPVVFLEQVDNNIKYRNKEVDVTELCAQYLFTLDTHCWYLSV